MAGCVLSASYRRRPESFGRGWTCRPKDAELTTSHGALSIKIFDGGPSGPLELWLRLRVLNQPARVELSDGTVLSAKLARVARSGAIKRRDGTVHGGAEMELIYWEWLPPTVANLIFVGRFEGGRRLASGNLVLQQGGACSSGHLRLQGALRWHLINGEGEQYAVASFDPEYPSTGAVLGDVAALDFVAGDSLDLPVLWAVDGHGATVGAIGPGRPRPITHRHRAPIPVGHHIEECWTAPLWIDAHALEVRAFASEPADATVFLNKLRGNVFNRPTGEVVELAFEAWGVRLPPEVVKEIAKRNSVAHKFMMFDELNGDIQDAADRVDMIQMVLAAAIAKYIGYSGPIVGWERDDMGALRVPEFWESGEIEEARRRFMCTR